MKASPLRKPLISATARMLLVNERRQSEILLETAHKVAAAKGKAALARQIKGIIGRDFSRATERERLRASILYDKAMRHE